MARERKYEVGAETIDFAAYRDKEPTALQTHFADWLSANVSPEFKTKDQAFAEGVRLAVALRMPYQRSQASHDRRAAASENGSAPAEKPARRTRAAKAETPAPAAKPARRRAATKAEAPPAEKPAVRRKPVTRRRPAAAAPAEDDF